VKSAGGHLGPVVRASRDGEIFSIWWASSEKLEVDLDADRAVLGTDRWRAQLIGSGVAPIAIAAVATRHGPAAIFAHPGLARFQGSRVSSVRCVERTRGPNPAEDEIGTRHPHLANARLRDTLSNPWAGAAD
jgi:hypothetical protein